MSKRLVGLVLLSSLMAACSSGSSSTAHLAPVTTHPFGITLSSIEHFFESRAGPSTSWIKGPPENEPGPLSGMDDYTAGSPYVKIEVIGNPADETELSVDCTIAHPKDAKADNALILATVQKFAPAAVDWIRGALNATDGAAGYFGGSSAIFTKGQIALTFRTSATKHHGLLLALAGGKVA